MEVIDLREMEKKAVLIGQQDEDIEFSVSNDPALMSMLSTGLYENPLRTMIQEVMFNAWDAHRMGKCQDTPIEIYLNTKSGLIVKDYGPGIPHDIIKPIYCVYGASTKRDDPTQTGGFGLGCKSPYAYTNSFMVISENQGKKNIYVANRTGAPNGGPSFTPVVRDVPTQDSGITVTVPLNDEQDMNKAHSYIRRILKHSGIFAKISMEGEETEIIKDSGIAPGEFLFDKDTPSTAVYAVYGGVPYQIKKVSEITEDLDLFTNLTRHLGSMYIHFDPDTLTPLPSREGLNMSQKTIENINRKIEFLYEQYRESIDPVMLNSARVIDEHLMDILAYPDYYYPQMIKNFIYKSGSRMSISNIWLSEREDFQKRMESLCSPDVSPEIYKALVKIIFDYSEHIFKIGNFEQIFKKELKRIAYRRYANIFSIDDSFSKGNDSQLRKDHRLLIKTQDAISKAIGKSAPVRYLTDDYTNTWTPTTRVRQLKARYHREQEKKYWEKYPDRKVRMFPSYDRLFFKTIQTEPRSIYSNCVILAKTAQCLKLMSNMNKIDILIKPNQTISDRGRANITKLFDSSNYRVSNQPPAFVVNDRKDDYKTALHILKDQGLVVIEAPDPPLVEKKVYEKKTTFPILRMHYHKTWTNVDEAEISDPQIWVAVTITDLENDRNLPNKSLLNKLLGIYDPLRVIALHNKRRIPSLQKIGAMSYEHAAFNIVEKTMKDLTKLSQFLVYEYLMENVPDTQMLESEDFLEFLGFDSKNPINFSPRELNEFLLIGLSMKDPRMRGEYHKELRNFNEIIKSQKELLGLDEKFKDLSKLEIFNAYEFRQALQSAPDKKAFIQKAIEFAKTI